MVLHRSGKMNKILKFLLILFLISISYPSIAQEIDPMIQKADDIDLEIKKKRPIFTPGAELRISIGFFPRVPDLFYIRWCMPDPSPSFSDENYSKLLENKGARIVTGAMSANLSYNILRWVSIGATFTYNGDSQKTYSRITQKEIGQNNTHNFMLVPMVRFNYLNKPIIRLYSQIGLGIGLERVNRQYSNESEITNDFYLTGQITFFGISVGRKLFGFAEFGYGAQGLLLGGVGYKF